MPNPAPDTQTVSSPGLTVYLDDLALLTDSKLVELEHPTIKLFVTPMVRKSIEDPNNPHLGASWARERLDVALKSGRVTYIPVDMTNLGLTPGIYGVYEDVLSHAVSRKRHGDNVLVVTVRDYPMHKAAESMDVSVTNPEGLRKLFDEAKQKDAEAKTAAAEQKRHERRKIVIEGIVGLLTALLGSFVWDNRVLIIRAFHVWGTLALIATVGLVLYGIRGRFRVLYGVAEVGVGLLAATEALAPQFDFNSVNWHPSVPLLAGLYVIVRGLDNIGNGLSGTQFEASWQKFSGEPRAK